VSAHDVIVVGGGTNGLALAALLAKAGRKVLLLEKRHVVGGLAAGEEFHPGYRSAGVLHDTSTVLPEVIEALSLEKHGLERASEPPSFFAPEREGPGLLLHHDPRRASSEIASRSSKDAESYAEYRAFLERVRPVLREALVSNPPLLEGPRSLFALARGGLAFARLGKARLRALARIPPMCVADYFKEWFATELLGCTLAAPSFAGSLVGPWSPGTGGTLLRHEALAHGAIEGGAPELVRALESAARGFGVEIRTGAALARLRVASRAVRGVTLADGEGIDAARVVSTCDPKRTFLEWISPDELPPRFAQRMASFRAKGQTAKVNLALSRPLRFRCRPDLEVEWARTGETFDEIERAFDASKYGQFSKRPVLDIHVPSLSREGFAPKGHHVASILAHWAPFDRRGGWNEAARKELLDAVLDEIEALAPGTRAAIVASELLAPADLEERFGISGGHIQHGEHGLDQLLSRPTPECARHSTPIAGLFLGGSGSFPGGGLTCAPAWLAARMLE
jgi:phytoene dehydrogenase-like protein